LSSTSTPRLIATYHVDSSPRAIDGRALALALEQSVELPLDAIDDRYVLDQIVGRVLAIEPLGPKRFEVRIALASQTAPPEAGQLMNMVFGNSSLQDDARLVDLELPAGHLVACGGPRVGLDGFRRKLDAGPRALTATALKPQGLSPVALGRLAGALAMGGIDIIKDDHGLADQSFSPFSERVAACAGAVREATRATGRRTIYAPSLSGSLDDLRRQLAVLREEGLEAALVAPMIIGLPAFQTLVREADGIALLAHPSLAGAQRIAPPLLLGRLFRLFGADATIFPNFGGRFAYSPETCRAIAERATEEWGALASTAPTPAGGMPLDRVDEMLEFYGRDCILLIGGSLLQARERISDVTAAFARRVADHGKG